MSALTRTATGDIAVPLSIQTDIGQLTQWKLTDELSLGQGEWQFDPTQGFPWIQRVLGIKGITLTQLRALFHQAILQTPAIVAVTDLQLTFDRALGELSYSFQATLNTGATLTGGSGQPFVVTGGTSS